MTMPMPGLLANYIIGGAQGPVPNASVQPPLSTEPNMTPAGPAVPNPTTVTPDVPAGANMSPALPPPVSAAKPASWQSAYDTAVKGEGGTDTGATNPKTGALGSFQLMRDQMPGLGVKPEDIKAMSYEQQRDELFPKYLASHGIKPDDLKTPADVGISIAAPAFLKSSDDTVISEKGKPWVRGTPQYDQNKMWDVNGDGAITRGDLARYYDKQGGGGAGQASGAPSTPNPLGDFITEGGSPGQVQHSRTTVGGIPQTPEDIARRGDALGNAKADVVSAYAPAMQAAAENRIAAIAAQDRAQQAADLQQQQKATAKTTYDSAIADEKSATQAVLDDQAPKPFGGNTFSLILATIGQAMGAYGAAITKTRNFAADMINQFLDRDMQAWKEKHLDLKYKAESLSKLTSQRRSDFDFEANAHARLQDQVTMRELQVAQANTQNADQQTHLGLTLASLQERYDGHEEELQRLARDHSQTTTSITEKQTGAAGPEEEAKRTRALVANGEDLDKVEAARAGKGVPSRIPLDKDQTATAGKITKEIEPITKGQQAVQSLLQLVRKYPKGDIPGTGVVEGSSAIQWPIVGQLAHAILSKNFATDESGNIAAHLTKDENGNLDSGIKQGASLDEVRANQQLINEAEGLLTIARTSVGIERNQKAIDDLLGAVKSFHRPEELRPYVERAAAALANQKDEAIKSNTDDPMIRRHFKESTFDPEKGLLPAGAQLVSP